jgi:hypothetical protein
MRRFLITGIALCCFAIAAPAFGAPLAALSYSTHQTQSKDKSKNKKKTKNMKKSTKMSKKSAKSEKPSKKKG